MNALLRFLLLLAAPFYAVDPNGGGDAGADAGTEGPNTAADTGNEGVADPAGADPADPGSDKAGPPKEVDVNDMAEAIAAGLGESPPERERGPDGKFLPKTEGQPAANIAARNPEELAAIEQKKTADKAAADAKALEGKTADSFQLSPEQLGVLKKESRERFHQLTTYAKARETELSELRPKMQELQQAREGILNIMRESQTEPDELGRLLDFNRMIKTGNYAPALKLVEEYRAQLYKVMGREAPGVDLVSEFDDLNARVDAGELSRDDAVALANGRRRDAALSEQSQSQQRQQQNGAQAQQQQDQALSALDAWTKRMAAQDPNYAAREQAVAPRIAKIIQTYPPHLWLPTIEEIYNVTPVPAARSNSIPSGPALLRPNGTKPGPAQPRDMASALSQGLGYSFTE